MSVRLKKLGEKLHGLALDEHDLARLAHIVQRIANDSGKHVDIEITSYDDEDVLKSNDPEVFFSREMIKKIKAIVISYTLIEEFKYTEPTIRVTIKLQNQGRTNRNILTYENTVEVYGSDTEKVTSTFYELRRELINSMKLPTWLTRIVISSVFVFLFSIVTATIYGFLVYTLFDVPIDIAIASVPGFAGSSFNSVIVIVGWILIFIALGEGFWKGEPILSRLFPPVTFRGQLSDSTRGLREIVIGVFMLIVMPILLNIFSTFITR